MHPTAKRVFEIPAWRKEQLLSGRKRGKLRRTKSVETFWDGAVVGYSDVTWIVRIAI
jgi:hypothetical protein